mmetsp:Transcript_47221/g.125428  ORF Transcript_47221/g.125428 Transcript_47221/m.125428 type:complete len:190 (-) Transcript_47221:109-678(-)
MSLRLQRCHDVPLDRPLGRVKLRDVLEGPSTLSGSYASYAASSSSRKHGGKTFLQATSGAMSTSQKRAGTSSASPEVRFHGNMSVESVHLIDQDLPPAMHLTRTLESLASTRATLLPWQLAHVDERSRCNSGQDHRRSVSLPPLGLSKPCGATPLTSSLKKCVRAPSSQKTCLKKSPVHLRTPWAVETH